MITRRHLVETAWRAAVFAYRAAVAARERVMRLKNSRAARTTVNLAVRAKDSRAGRTLVRLAVRAKDSRTGRAATREAARFVDWALARLRGDMTSGERAMLEALGEGREPACLLRTRSRVDVGEWCNPWWGGARLWLAVVADEVAVFAHGKRPHSERFASADLGASQYNAVMSELVLAATAEAVLRKLRLPPVEGWQVLGHIKARGD